MPRVTSVFEKNSEDSSALQVFCAGLNSFYCTITCGAQGIIGEWSRLSGHDAFDCMVLNAFVHPNFNAFTSRLRFAMLIKYAGMN